MHSSSIGFQVGRSRKKNSKYFKDSLESTYFFLLLYMISFIDDVWIKLFKNILRYLMLKRINPLVVLFFLIVSLLICMRENFHSMTSKKKLIHSCSQVMIQLQLRSIFVVIWLDLIQMFKPKFMLKWIQYLVVTVLIDASS